MIGAIPVLMLWLCFIIIAVVAYAVYRENRKKYEKTEYFAQTHTPYSVMRHDRGKSGEFHIYECLSSLNGYKKFLFNTYLPKSNGTTTEVDIIMLHESGVYVIESKNYGGSVYGDEASQQWVQVLPASGWSTQKNAFFNPVIQNAVHMKWLQKYTGYKNSPFFHSLVIFSDRCNLNVMVEDEDCCVMNCCEVAPLIGKFYKTVGNNLSKEEIDFLYERLYPLTQTSEEEKCVHIENIQEHSSIQYFEEENAAKGKTCPCCGGRLVVRTATKGYRAGKKFLGCSNYPSCNFIENIDD